MSRGRSRSMGWRVSLCAVGYGGAEYCWIRPTVLLLPQFASAILFTAYGLLKSKLHSGGGMVSWERQQQIKAKLREVFRLL